MKFLPLATFFTGSFLLAVGINAPLPGMSTAANAASEPIHIAADQMVSSEQTNVVVFKGNVDATQGNLVIESEKMSVYYSEKNNTAGADKSSKVEKLICKGGVKITQGDWLGKGDQMVYLAKERKVILSGNAKAFQGGNMVTGTTITYFLDEGRSIVDDPDTITSQPGTQSGKPHSGRVQAVIQPEAH